jgi:hypothetical protein
MIRRVICWISFAVLLGICLPLGAQAQGMTSDGYVDDFVVHVKGSCSQYGDLVKKLVTANRKDGDNWLALQETYGDSSVVRFVATRATYAEIEAAQGKFMAALMKAEGGEAGAMKLFGQLGACADSQQGVLRARRWDLSLGRPADNAAYAQVIGNTRWVRIYTVHVKPGMAGRYEAAVKAANAAMLKANPNASSWFTQSVAGDNGTTYYISQLRTSLGGFDSTNMPSMRSMMGDAAFEAYQKEISEVVTRTDVAIFQVSPSMSNPPADVVAVAPNFWRPKPPAPKKAATAAPKKTS